MIDTHKFKKLLKSMRCKCKILSLSEPASDGSMVSREVIEAYLNSEECKEALRLHKMLGTLTHRSRSVISNFPESGAQLSKVIGSDDSALVVSEKAPSPTHYVEKLYIEDGWLWGVIKVLEEEGMDDIAIQNIRRLSGLLKQSIMPGVSAVIVGYWKGVSGADHLEKLVNLKGIDVTLNPSWKKAGIMEIMEGSEDEKQFSETSYTPEDFKFSGIKVKAFSDISSLGITAPKSSKINGQFTSLKAKEFSCDGATTIFEESVEVPEVSASEEQKNFTMAAVKDRLREAKFSPRVYFRRIYINYRQAVKSLGGVGNLKPEDEKILRALFTSDVLYILNLITPDIIKGKQINTLLGCSAVSKTARIEAQKLQIPLRMAMMESKRQGFVSKVRYQKLQEAYLSFIRGLMEDVFGSNEPIPETPNAETEENNTEE